VRIITDKILLSSLLVSSLFLTGCSLTGEETKPTPVEVSSTEAKDSPGFFSSWFGDDEDDSKSAGKEDPVKKSATQSAVAKKYPKLTEDQQKAIAKIKLDAEAERKRRIEAVKVSNINAKVVAKIAKQTRLEDVEARLKNELNILNEQLKSEEQNLAKIIKAELETKIKTLDSETQDNIAQIKSDVKGQRIKAISSVERKISDAQSEVESRLMKKALATELDRFYVFKDNERKLEEQYLNKLSNTKIELDKEREKQLKIMAQNIRAMKQSNKELLNIRAAELERQRVAEAIEIEKRAKAKNQAMIEKLIAKFKSEADEYSSNTKSKLSKQEESVLSAIASKHEQGKAKRAAKEKSYKASLNNEITEAKKTAGNKMRDNLISERDAKITTIDERLESAIRGVYAERKNSLSQLESDNQAQHKQKVTDLKTQYGKDKKSLIGQSKKDKSSIISKAKARERELLIKERKAIDVINKQNRADIKSKSKSAVK